MLDDYKCWGCDVENETVIAVDLGDDVGYYCFHCRKEREEMDSEDE